MVISHLGKTKITTKMSFKSSLLRMSSSLSCQLLLWLWFCVTALSITISEAAEVNLTSNHLSSTESSEDSLESAKPENLPPEYEEEFNFGSGFNKSGVAKSPPTAYKEGPLPTISDSVFSLIILIYVSVIFIFMFFSFCWKEPEPPPPDPAHKNIPMITSMLEEMEKQMNKKQSEDGMNGGARNGNGNHEGEEGTEMTEIHIRHPINGEEDSVNVITEKSKIASKSMTIKEEVEEEEAATQV